MYSLSLKCGGRLTAFKRISHFPGHLNFAALCPVETGEDGPFMGRGPACTQCRRPGRRRPAGAGRGGVGGGAAKPASRTQAQRLVMSLSHQ